MNQTTNPLALRNTKEYPYVKEENATLAIVNHEIRNSLTLIKLHAQLLEKSVRKNGKFSPSSLAAGIVKSVDGITNILDQYLSETSENSILNEFVEFDLAELVTETLQNFRSLHPGYTFILQGSGKCDVKANKCQIEQVLVNYLNNAVKFSPKNSRIIVILNTGFAGTDLGVIDEGMGVPEGLEKKIFDRYYKIEHSTIQQDSSRGLGLYLVKEIIDRHNGQVWLQRSRAGGSIFYFRLPR